MGLFSCLLLSANLLSRRTVMLYAVLRLRVIPAGLVCTFCALFSSLSPLNSHFTKDADKIDAEFFYCAQFFQSLKLDNKVKIKRCKMEKPNPQGLSI